MNSFLEGIPEDRDDEEFTDEPEFEHLEDQGPFLDYMFREGKRLAIGSGIALLVIVVGVVGASIFLSDSTPGVAELQCTRQAEIVASVNQNGIDVVVNELALVGQDLTVIQFFQSQVGEAATIEAYAPCNDGTRNIVIIGMSPNGPVTDVVTLP